MSEQVQLSREGQVAIATIHNPPVNALSPAVCEGLNRVLNEIEGNGKIVAAVIACSGRTFIAGGDIAEFVKFTTGKKKRDGSVLLDLLRRIEDCKKPIVAAIHGTALGGGLELSMAAHYRIATADASIGQPEVKLGLIPGAGGTQRLPRLAGVRKAIDMCVSGSPIPAAEALELGIVDRVAKGDLLACAIDFAREAAARPPRKTRDRTDKLGVPGDYRADFEAARHHVQKKHRGRKAPLKAIAAIEAATLFTFEEGCAREQQLFHECLFDDESKALVHLFFAEREAAKLPGVDPQAARRLRTAAVLGAGAMGTGIAMGLANTGIPVVVRDVDRVALDGANARIRARYEDAVRRGRCSQAVAEERIGRIRLTSDYEGFDSADFVIEAVVENLRLKKDVFSQLDRICKPDAVLATNTSSLDIDEISAATSRPENVVGLHFFNPADAMRLVEVIPGRRTAPDIMAVALRLAKHLGKIAVLAGNCAGFIGNRMFGPYRREAQFLIEEGATIEQVDQVLYDFGMAMGPCATADLAGIDIRRRMRQERPELVDSRVRQPFLEDQLCEMGRFGRKTGAGYYSYADSRGAVPDPEVELLVRRWAQERGILQRQITATEILDRCLLALINEGARLLQEGFALRPGDIDVVFVHGYGFPAHRGGPMWYADVLGLQNVHAKLEQLKRSLGDIWQPAPLIETLSKTGLTFSQWHAERSEIQFAWSSLQQQQTAAIASREVR